MMKRARFFMLASLAVLLLFQGAAPAHGADATPSKKKELQRIKRAMQEKKRAISRADKRERSILSDIDTFDRSIQTGRAELAEQQGRLRDAETSLRDIEKSAAAVTSDLTRLKRLYALRIRALYKMGRNGNASAILATDNFTLALKRIKYLGLVAERDRKVMRDYMDALARLSEKQTELAGKREEVLRRTALVEARSDALENQRRSKARILSEVRSQKVLYKQTLNELQDASRDLWNLIKKAEQERKTAPAARDTLRRSAPRASSAGSARLPWPLNGQVLSRFGMQRHPEFGTMVFRRGIEIEAREGTAVHTVDNGQVAYADWYKGFGKLVIIEHRTGLYTLYGHLSRVDVSNGGQVARGQVIGLAGDTGSMKGPRLYFELRHNGDAVDPLSWLVKR